MHIDESLCQSNGNCPKAKTARRLTPFTCTSLSMAFHLVCFNVQKARQKFFKTPYGFKPHFILGN
jgi:hypothetical protein